MTSLTDLVALYLFIILFLFLVWLVVWVSCIACLDILILADRLVGVFPALGAAIVDVWDALTNPKPITPEAWREGFFGILGGYAALMTATWATGSEFLTWYAPSLEPDGSLVVRALTAGVCTNAVALAMHWARMGTRRFIAELRETRLPPTSHYRVPHRWRSLP